VLDDALQSGVDGWVLGGDFVAFGPEPSGTLARLRELSDAIWIRGNTERWLVETPLDVPQVWRGLHETSVRLDWDQIEWLYSLPVQAELEGVLYVHGSPLSDVESFAPQPEDGEERMLAGVRDRTIVFGHTHRQLRRSGPDGTELLNPGSVGQPLDGDPRPGYALRHDDGTFELRRIEYDHRAAAAAMRELGDWTDAFAHRIEFASA
jgi:diadenosine tetraphosphatase ApaH/serine/threonine PP2A family protein phosphatase